ncbi:MAG TPA: hypothetical protein VIM10_11480 [Actinopolymorphaceae bacterium]
MKCDWCQHEMSQGLACNSPTYAIAGRTFQRIAFVPHRGDLDAQCHDCLTTVGGLHHPGCDVERCPRCGGQAIGCGCHEDDS